MKLSVLIPLYNEKNYISSCLDSVLSQDFPKEEMELLLMDGMSTDGTREIIEEFARKHENVILIDNPERIVPCAMNRGIRVARGEIILRMDAHASYASSYCSTLVNWLERLDAANVGCVWKTDVKKRTSVALAIREVLSSRLGVGNSQFRIGADEVMLVDTVPFGCWRKSTFEKYGMFDERLVRNQDIELNRRIERMGGKIYLVPDTTCTYYARETFPALAKNNFENGKWNLLTLYLTHSKSLSIRHFIPLLFVLSLLLPILFSPLYAPLIFVAVASLCAYLFLVFFVSAKLSLSKKLNFCSLIFAFLTLHLSYGIGSLWGLGCCFVCKKSR